jgi:hypothetical protein
VINGWWLAGDTVGTLLLMIPGWRLAYRYGIRDGAFNQHLPVVRREMVLYDKDRAEEIFEAEDYRVSFPSFHLIRQSADSRHSRDQA